jgi:hypothetical protein
VPRDTGSPQLPPSCVKAPPSSACALVTANELLRAAAGPVIILTELLLVLVRVITAHKRIPSPPPLPL